MKLNIASRETGGQISVDIDDDKKLIPFFEKRIGAEVPADSLGDQFKGYILRITGGNDKQGFPMLQGVLTTQRVRLLFRDGMKCFRERRSGQKRRKSVRGCIVSPNLSVINAIVAKKGDQDVPGLTDIQRPRRVGPKRANKIRKMFNLTKDDDVRPYVPRRIVSEGEKPKTKAPKVQRLITATRLQRKRQYKKETRERREKSIKNMQEYKQILENYQRTKRAEKVVKKNVKKQDSATVSTTPIPGAS